MKKKIFLFALFAGLTLSACSGGNKPDPTPTPEPEPEPVVEKSISLSHKQLNLDLHESQKITVYLTNISGKVTWESSNSDVASVNQDGVVEALKEGTTVVKASIESYFATCSVSVVSSETAPVLKLSTNNVCLAKDGSYSVTATTTYKNKTVENVKYTWQSAEAEGLLTYQVNEATDKATFTGVTCGEATFYVSATVFNIPLVETLFIEVNNPYVSFDFLNIDCDESGYKTSLSTIDAEESKSSIYINMDLYDHNVCTHDAQNLLTWTSDDETIARVESGSIVAKRVGQTTIHGEYEGNIADILVKVFIPVIETKTLSSSYVLDKNSGEEYSTIDLTEAAMTGELDTVTFKGNVIGSGSFENNILSIANNSLIENKMFGEGDIEAIFANKVSGETVSYSKVVIHSTIATKVIKTVADLNGFGALAKQESSEKGIWDGYFVLGNDINYTGTFKSFINYQYLNDAGKGAAYQTGYNAGFKGTFNGKNHVINNFKLGTGESGFVGVICTGGVVKNISFTNVVMGAASSLINESGDGLIENVFVDCNEQLQGWGVNSGQKSGFFYTFRSSESAQIRNCFVYTDVSKAVMTSSTAVAPILGTIKTIGQAENVCVVGITNGLVQFINNAQFVNYANNETYGAYATLTDLQAAGVDFSGWANDFYEVKGGLPVPKSLAGGEIRITNEDMYVGEGSKVAILTELTGVPSVVYELDSASIQAGFSIDENIVTVPANSRGASFTVTVRSKYDASVKDSMEFNVAIIMSQTILPSTVKKANSDDESSIFSYDLTSLSISNEFMFSSVIVGTKVLNGSKFVNNVVIANKSELEYIYGQKDVIVKFNKMVNDTIDTILEVKCPTLFITKILSTYNDLDYLGAYAKAEEKEAYKWGGYYELDRNIDYKNASGYTHFITWDKLNSLGKASVYNTGVGGGFIGTINGKGFNIDGFTTGTASNGLVGVLGSEGVIKNLSFTNVTLPDACSLLSASGNGTVENLYVDCISEGNGWAVNSDQKSGFINTFKSGDDAIMRNVFIKTNIEPVPEGKTRVAPVSVGTTGSLDNVINVYAIGAENGVVMYYDAATYWAMPNNETYGSYVTEDDFKTAGIDLSGFNGDFWMIDNGLPISVSAYNKAHSVSYTVNHYLAKNKDSQSTDKSTYKLYKEEVCAGIAGQLTDAKALSLTGFSAEAITQQTILDDSTTVVDIFYSRDMKVQSFEQSDLGWFNPETAGKGDVKLTNQADTRIKTDKTGNTLFVGVFNSNAGDAWISYFLTDEQIAQVGSSKTLSFRVKLENQASEDNLTYTLVSNCTADFSTKSLVSKKIGTGEWATITLTNFVLDSKNRVSFYFKVNQGDGFAIYLDDFIAK